METNKKRECVFCKEVYFVDGKTTCCQTRKRMNAWSKKPEEKI